MTANSKVDLTPAILDLALYAGDGEDFQIVVKDEAAQPIDVSHLVWTAQIRKTRASTTASNLTIDMTSAGTGVIKIHIPASITNVLAKLGQWDLQYTNGSGDPVTILQGSVTCSQDVTR